MKILITRSSENQTTGGAELSAKDQAIVLKKLGYNPVFLSNNTNLRSVLKKSSISAYPSIYMQRFKPPLRYVYFFAVAPFKFLYDLIIALAVRPDIINPHTREDQISFTLLKPLHRRPVVWKDPGDMFFVFNQPHSAFGRFYKKLYLYASKKADAIYLLNDSDRDSLLALLGKEYGSKLYSIPSSILYDEYSPSYEIKQSDTLIFGSICRLTDIKNISTTISAYLDIKNKLPKSQLLIVGDGPDRPNLEAIAKGDPDIIFTGPTKDISPHLNNIDIFIHSALQEGWGRNIKEAMYFGKPVIGANVGGIAKQITDRENGLLFNPKDIKQLTNLMLELASDKKLRQKIATNARKKATKDGDFTNIIQDQIIPIYKSVTSAK